MDAPQPVVAEQQRGSVNLCAPLTCPMQREVDTSCRSQLRFGPLRYLLQVAVVNDPRPKACQSWKAEGHPHKSQHGHPHSAWGSISERGVGGALPRFVSPLAMSRPVQFKRPRIPPDQIS